MPKKSTHPEHEEDAYPHTEQGILPPTSSEDRRLAMSQGEKDEEVYDNDGIEAMRDDDEIDDWEAGFMEGAHGKGQKANCAHCDKPLPSKAKVIEKSVDGELMAFCSSGCAGKGPM